MNVDKIENGLERGFVKHRLNCLLITDPLFLGQHFPVSLLLDVPSYSFYLTKLEVIKMKTQTVTILVLILSQKKLPVNVRTRVPVAVILLHSPTTVNIERCELFAQGRARTVVSIGLNY